MVKMFNFMLCIFYNKKMKKVFSKYNNNNKAEGSSLKVDVRPRTRAN